MTDAGLKELRGLKGLQSLDISGTQVTDAGPMELSGLKSLFALNLSVRLMRGVAGKRPSRSARFKLTEALRQPRGLLSATRCGWL